VTVRELVRSYQREIQQTPDLLPDRAADLLNKLASLIGNVNDEIREADAVYAQHLLQCLDSEEKANRAKIRAEISPEFQRRQEARDTKELVIELSRSLKYYLRAKADELQLARHQ
jgi:hypothetical protein